MARTPANIAAKTMTWVGIQGKFVKFNGKLVFLEQGCTTHGPDPAPNVLYPALEQIKNARNFS